MYTKHELRSNADVHFFCRGPKVASRQRSPGGFDQRRARVTATASGESHPESYRLQHIHRNVPGVLSRINQVFGENNINIAAQYLQTNAQIGYVVIDVEAEHSQAAVEKLRGVDGTIRTRVLF